MKKIVFLHHSTGKKIWLGGTNRYIYKLTGYGDVQSYFRQYNKANGTSFEITEQIFPKESPYGWKNYPFDYYNIWVKNSGFETYMEEPTLEILTREYDVIILKHCYPVCNILPDTGKPDINSEEKRLENYKLQYNALKQKFYEFHDKKFIVWTPAAQVRKLITEDEARRTKEFCEWIINEWDAQNDNIYVWDFHNYETDGGLYLLDKYAEGENNSHPNASFSAYLAPLFSKFIIDVISNKH